MRADYVYGLNDECLVIYACTLYDCVWCGVKSNNNHSGLFFRAYGPLQGTGRIVLMLETAINRPAAVAK